MTDWIDNAKSMVEYLTAIWDEREKLEAQIPGRWFSVEERLPETDDSVLIVKELKNGTRQMAIGYCNLDHVRFNAETGERTREPYWVCGGNNNVIYWQPLPRMPGEDVEYKTWLRNLEQAKEAAKALREAALREVQKEEDDRK